MQSDKDKGIKHFLCLVLYRDTPFQEKKKTYLFLLQSRQQLNKE